jgi:hypothetical protein
LLARGLDGALAPARADLHARRRAREGDRLEQLLKIPYLLSLGWLNIDPNFDPLRGNPRFKKLVAGAK